MNKLVDYQYIADKAQTSARRMNGAMKFFDNPPKKAGYIPLSGAGRGKAGFKKDEVDKWIDSFNGEFRKAFNKAACAKQAEYKGRIYVKDEEDFIPVRKLVVIDTESPIHQGFLFNKLVIQARLAA